MSLFKSAQVSCQSAASLTGVPYWLPSDDRRTAVSRITRVEEAARLDRGQADQCRDRRLLRRPAGPDGLQRAQLLPVQGHHSSQGRFGKDPVRDRHRLRKIRRPETQLQAPRVGGEVCEEGQDPGPTVSNGWLSGPWARRIFPISPLPVSQKGSASGLSGGSQYGTPVRLATDWPDT